MKYLLLFFLGLSFLLSACSTVSTEMDNIVFEETHESLNISMYTGLSYDPALHGLYYLRPSEAEKQNELWFFDLSTKENMKVEFSPIENEAEYNIISFKMNWPIITYISQMCDSRVPCDLNYYNFETGEYRLLLDDYGIPMNASGLSYDYDPETNKVVITESDGYFGKTLTWKELIDLNTGEKETVESYTYIDGCTEETLGTNVLPEYEEEGDCTEEVLNGNKDYLDFIETNKTISPYGEILKEYSEDLEDVLAS